MQFFKGYKKLKMAIAGVIIVIVTSYIPGIDEAALTKIVYLIISYIFGQGMADFAKEGKGNLLEALRAETAQSKAEVEAEWEGIN